MSRLTNYERETIINFNEGEDTASVYTHNKALRRRLELLAQERPEECQLYKVTHWDEAVEYYIPKRWLKINPTRILSEAQREALEKARGAAKTAVPADVGACLTSGPGKDIPQPPDIEKEA